MSRGNKRELDRARAQNRAGNQKKGNDDGLSFTQKQERDKLNMQNKQKKFEDE